MMTPPAPVGVGTTTQGPQKSSGKSYKDKRRERQMARQQGQGGAGEGTPQQDSWKGVNRICDGGMRSRNLAKVINAFIHQITKCQMTVSSIKEFLSNI